MDVVNSSDSFIVHCPSDSPTGDYHETLNSNTTYTVRLPDTIYLKPNEWEVALTQITVPNHFENIYSPFNKIQLVGLKLGRKGRLPSLELSIPAGCYDGPSFVQTVNSMIKEVNHWVTKHMHQYIALGEQIGVKEIAGTLEDENLITRLRNLNNTINETDDIKFANKMPRLATHELRLQHNLVKELQRSGVGDYGLFSPGDIMRAEIDHEDESLLMDTIIKDSVAGEHKTRRGIAHQSTVQPASPAAASAIKHDDADFSYQTEPLYEEHGVEEETEELAVDASVSTYLAGNESVYALGQPYLYFLENYYRLTQRTELGYRKKHWVGPLPVLEQQLRLLQAGMLADTGSPTWFLAVLGLRGVWYGRNRSLDKHKKSQYIRPRTPPILPVFVGRLTYLPGSRMLMLSRGKLDQGMAFVHPRLREMVGMVPPPRMRQMVSWLMSEDQTEEIVETYLMGRTDLAPDRMYMTKDLQYLYIYCSAVAPSIVGNQYTRIIRVFNILEQDPNKAYKEQVSTTFDQALYYPVDAPAEGLKEISITLGDSWGMPFKLLSTGTTMAVLHFRKKAKFGS